MLAKVYTCASASGLVTGWVIAAGNVRERGLIAAKLAAYNLGISIKRHWGRPDFAFATLIV